MGIIERIGEEQRKKEREERDSKLSGYELNVQRMEGLLIFCGGDMDKAIGIVSEWLQEAQRRRAK